MKKLLFIPLLFVFTNVYCPPDTKIYILRHEGYKPFENVSFEQIWSAICFIESSGNAKAYNEAEDAVGISQIRKAKLQDYNKATNNNIQHEDCFDVEISKLIFKWHFEQQGCFMAAISKWNGSGQQAHRYMNRVLKIIEHQNNNQYETF